MRHKILVLSGKGGVGKSTFAAQLGFGLSERDAMVGLMDIDICGPSAPKMTGLEGEEVRQVGNESMFIFISFHLFLPLVPIPDLTLIAVGFLNCRATMGGPPCLSRRTLGSCPWPSCWTTTGTR